MKTRFALAALALACAPVLAQSANTATISFTRPTTYADGSPLDAATPVTYNLYQGLQGQPKTKVATISTTASTVTTGLLGGKTYCWTVSAVANSLEGAQSVEGCKTFPQAAPSQVTITVQ